MQVLFSDSLLICERTFNGKLTAWASWMPEAVDRASAADDQTHPLKVRQANEALAFGVPSAEVESWVHEVGALIKSNAKLAKTGSGLGVGASVSFGRSQSIHPSRVSKAERMSHRLGADSPVSPGHGASALFAGWLQKKGGGGADGNMRNWAKGGRRNWKSRWMVISSDQFLSWYENEKQGIPKGSLALHGAQVTWLDLT